MSKENWHACPNCSALVSIGCSRNAVHGNDIAITGGHEMFLYNVSPVPNQLWLQENTIGLQKCLIIYEEIEVPAIFTTLHFLHYLRMEPVS